MGKKAKIRKEKREEKAKTFQEEIKTRKNTGFDFWALLAKPASIIVMIAILAAVAFPFYKNYQDNKKMYAILKTTNGDIKLELFKKDAPNTVDNMVKLANKGYFKHLLWHRVIKDFVIQTGDPKGDGTGGPGYQFNDEINSHKFTAGTVGMANAGANTNGSQFFIVTNSDQTSLDGKYTAFAQVVEGMDVVTKIAEVPTDKNDKPIAPVYLEDVIIQ